MAHSKWLLRLKQLLKPPPGDLWMDAVLWFGASLFCVWWIWRHERSLLDEGWLSLESVLLIATIVAACGYWLAHEWVRWFVLTLGTLVLFLITGRAILTGEFSLWGVAAAAFCVYGLWNTWHEEITPRPWNDEEASDSPMTSLVLLLREPMYLDAQMIARLASRAWEAEITAHGDDAPGDESAYGMVIGDAGDPFFALIYGPGLFMFNNHALPYYDDPAAAAEACRELRTRSAVAEHNAWVSADLVWSSEGGENGEAEAYRLIGRFLAELADQHQCLAVVEPRSGAIHPFDPQTEDKLRSDDPRAALADWYYDPIIPLKDEDIVEAVEEARRRWPEFVAAFEARDEDSPPCMIKAPFRAEDNVEYMWVEVTAVEGDVVYGILKNHPHAIPRLREGDRVHVAVPDVNDWICVIDDAPVGGFTMKAPAQG